MKKISLVPPPPIVSITINEFRISEVTVSATQIVVSGYNGYVDGGGNFVPTSTVVNLVLKDDSTTVPPTTDYTDVTTALGSNTVPAFDSFWIALLQKLIDKGVINGTVA